MAQYSPYLQWELASDSQPVESLGDPVHVLRDPLRGSLQHDEVELCGNPEPKLLQHVKGAGYVSLHDDRVSTQAHIMHFLSSWLRSEGWNQYMHDQ